MTDSTMPPKDFKDSALYRWSVLVFISLTMFASYFFYDVYSAVKPTLLAETGISNAEYGMYYGAYSFTISFLLMGFFGGIILDRWGIRKTSTLFITFMLLGSFVTAYGTTSVFRDGGVGHGLFSAVLPGISPSLKAMVLGRIIFGFGAETFYVCINKIIAKWFKNRELALAFAINVAFGRLGTALVFSLAPRVAGTPPAIDPVAWMGVIVMIIALVAFIAFTFMDEKHDRTLGFSEHGDDGDQFTLADIYKLLSNRAFIYVTTLCVLFYSAVFPFLGFAPDFLHNKYGFSLEASGDLATILPYGTIVFTPIFGWFCDKKGKSASIMIVGSAILLVVHVVFALTSFQPYIPLFLLGMAFSLVPAAMWPAVAKIVDERRLGTAYGFMFTIQNYGLMFFPWIMGLTLDLSNKGNPPDAPLDYTNTILVLAVLGVVGLLFAMLLKREDKAAEIGLELPNIE